MYLNIEVDDLVNAMGSSDKQEMFDVLKDALNIKGEECDPGTADGISHGSLNETLKIEVLRKMVDADLQVLELLNKMKDMKLKDLEFIVNEEGL